jgi:hypothetical protein
MSERGEFDCKCWLKLAQAGSVELPGAKAVEFCVGADRRKHESSALSRIKPTRADANALGHLIQHKRGVVRTAPSLDIQHAERWRL